MSGAESGRRHISRGTFLKGAAGLIGAAAAVGAGPAWAQSAPGVTAVRPMSGHLAGSRSGRTAELSFHYPGGDVVYTVEVHVEPDGLIGPRAGFKVYNPTGSVHVVGGAQSGLIPNVSANVVSMQPGTYVVQVFNYHETAGLDYWVRVRPGRREGQAVPVAPSFGSAATTPLIVYVGTGGRGEGVHTFRLDPITGELSRVDVAKIEGPGWVTLDPEQRFLYAAISGNRVASFGIDQTTGKLTGLNVQPTGTGGHAHVSVDPSGQFLVGASWGAGTVGVHPIGPDGQLGEASQIVKHEGPPGPHPTRRSRAPTRSPSIRVGGGPS